MPFTVTFSIDEDKMGPESTQAGDLTVRYSSPPGAENPLGNWHYSERYEAGDESAMADVCEKFEFWRAKREIEIGIEAALKAELEPLCPCHEESDESEDEEPTPE